MTSIAKRSMATLSAAILLLLTSEARGEELELRAAVKAGKVTANVHGAGLKQVRLTLRAEADLTVVIQAGTLFDTPKDARFQRMVMLHELRVQLKAGVAATVEAETACANFHRRVPEPTDRFSVGRAPRELELLVRCLDAKKLSHHKLQVAIWILTDGLKVEQLDKRPEMIQPLLTEKCIERLKGHRERCQKMVKKGLILAPVLMEGIPELVRSCRAK